MPTLTATRPARFAPQVRPQVHRIARLGLALAACFWLAGCEELGIESVKTVTAKREAEGKAVGGACRHAARSIEECFQGNKRADKAAVFAGWREMEDYMRENKIEAVPAKPDTVTANAEAAGGEAEDPASDPAKSAKPGKDGKGAKDAKAGSAVKNVKAGA